MQLEVISMADAKARGLRQYFTGKPCGAGHIAPRIVSNRMCLSCHNEASRKRIIPREVTQARNRRQYEKHGEVIRERVREYRAQNAEVLAEKMRTYRIRKPWIKRNLNAKRRAVHERATVRWNDELDGLAFQEAADLCARRGAATGITWHLDHIIPLQARTACGLHCAANLQVIPAVLNLSKSNRMILTQPAEWVRFL